MSDANNGGGAVVVEETDDEIDSTFGDNESSLTTSLTPSVFNFRYENGRRYHAYSERKYPIPNDEIELDRLDLQHHAFKLTLDGKLYRAPIRKDVHHVLDIGTGTGIWAMEFCDLHPSAQVIGTDLSPIQPSAVPPNCSFLIDDCEQEWLFHQKFDLVHTRALVAAIKDWPRLFAQAFDHLEPGGYIELQEIACPIMAMDPDLTPETSPLLRWSSLFTDAAAQMGLDTTAPRYLGQKLREAGFVGINLKIYTWPVGQWANGEKWKVLGKYVHQDLLDWLAGGSLMLFTKILGWSRERMEVFLAEVRRELKERKERHFYGQVMMWYARKPLPGEHWNPTADTFTLEDSIQLGVDEQLDHQEHLHLDTNARPLASPGPLVEPTSELSLDSPDTLGSASTTRRTIDQGPKYEPTVDDDSSETSTIHTPQPRPTTSPTINPDDGALINNAPGVSYEVHHTTTTSPSPSPSPKTVHSTADATPPPLSLGGNSKAPAETKNAERARKSYLKPNAVKGKEEFDVGGRE